MNLLQKYIISTLKVFQSRERETGKEVSPVLTIARLGQAIAKSLELKPGLPHEVGV